MTTTNFTPEEQAAIDALPTNIRPPIKATWSNRGQKSVGVETDDDFKSSAANVGWVEDKLNNIPGVSLNYNNYVNNAQYIGDTKSGATDRNGSTADYDTLIPIFEQQETTPVNYYRIYDANELGETIRSTNITDGTIVAKRKY